MPPSATLVMITAALVTGALIAVVILRARPAAKSASGARVLAEHVVEMVSTHSADGTFRYVSPVFAGLIGKSPGALVGKHPRDFAHPDDAQTIGGLWSRTTLWSGAPAVAMWRCRRLNGEYAWLESTARTSAGSEAAELGEVVCASRDVTERKQIEDALRESENRFRSALETVSLVAVGLDPQGRVTFCNDSFCALTGWTRAELIGENWFDFALVPADPSRAIFYKNIGAGNIPPKHESEIICKDGKRRTIDWDTTVLHTARGDVLGIASLGADVTERKQEETALKLLQSITLSISASNDVNGALELTLESLCRATRWSYGEAWLPTDEGDRIKRVTQNAAVGVDASALSDAGRDLLFGPGEGLTGQAWESRTVVWMPDLGSVSSGPSLPRAAEAIKCGLHSAVAIPVLTGQQVVAVLVFFMDRPRATDVRHTQMVEVVTNQVGAVIERRLAQKRYEAELLRTRDAARAASHAKSEFLSRMSHELRTPLNSVIGFANVLKKNKSGRLAPDDIAFLERITANGQHLLTLVNNVLDIAKVEAGRLTVTTALVNIDQLLRDVVSQLDGQPRPAAVALRADVPDDMVPIVSDHVLLRQVLINLTGNALRFTVEGSVVLSADVDENGVPLRMHVRDTGIGIGPELHEIIFEPFEQADQTTQRKYGGTGLGLAISKAICDALGYRLSVESEVGKGSTFTVHLDAIPVGPFTVSDSDRAVPISDNSAVTTKGSRARETQKR